MNKVISTLFLLGLLVNTSAYADEEVKVQVVEKYIELRTGPADTFPATYSVDKGDKLLVVKERNDWYQLQHADGASGWVPRSELEKTIVVSGVSSDSVGKRFIAAWDQTWELGLGAGTFTGETLVTFRGAYHFDEMWGTEFAYSTMSKNVEGSDITTAMWQGSLIAAPFGRQVMFDDWNYTPFFKLGAGLLDFSTAEKAGSGDFDQTIPAVAESGATFNLGGGLRFYITRNAVLRFDADYIYVMMDEIEDQTQAVNDAIPSSEFAFTAGFSVFF